MASFISYANAKHSFINGVAAYLINQDRGAALNISAVYFKIAEAIAFSGILN